MANVTEEFRKEVKEAVSEWLKEKLQAANDEQAYHQLAAGVADAVLQSLECQTVEPEMPPMSEKKLHQLLPLVQPLAAALLALLGAWLGGPLVAFLAVWFAWVGFKWLKRSPGCKCGQAAATPEMKLGIDRETLDQQLSGIAFLFPASGQQQYASRDLLADEGFHRWLQQFAVKVHRRGDYNDRQILLSLKDTLENFGLYIYDELEEDDNGNIVLPPLEDAFMDMREGEAWTAVTLPAVYTHDKVLLCGVIK